MQEFSLQAFVDRVRSRMYDLFPYENELINQTKHKGRTGNIRDVAFMNNQVIVGENTITFDIGNNYAEERYPYYHILQDSPVIRKRDRGTEKTRGSQASLKDLGQLQSRDYGRVSFNGKTYSKEYAKNIRGKRNSVVERATRFEYNDKGQRIRINPNSLSYKNEHYQYINKILETSIREVAPEFGYRLVQVKGTSLKDDYAMQQEMDSVIEDMINSFIYDEGEEDYE